MKILVLNTLNERDFNAFYPPEVQRRLEGLGTVHYLKYTNTEEERKLLKEQIRDVDVLFTNWGTTAAASGFDSSFYAAAKKLRMMVHTGGSVADLVTEDMRKRKDFALLSGNRCMAQGMAQGTLLYILAGMKWLYPLLKSTENGRWGSMDQERNLNGRIVGIVGFGMIAKEVIRLLQVFRCGIKVWCDYPLPEEEKAKYNVEFCSMEEVFSTCDVISIHLGMTPGNYHIVDEAMLAKIKDDALLVNTARGALIDEAALEKEVRSGRIRAALDVFEVEPLPMDSGLRGLDNVLITPHAIGGDNQSGSTTMSLIDDIERYFSGNYELENRITMEYASHMTNHALVSDIYKKKQV